MAVMLCHRGLVGIKVIVTMMEMVHSNRSTLQQL
jgi:hypothetical protein